MAELPYKTGPVTLGDRVLLGFGGALAGFFTGLLLFLLVNWLLIHLDRHYMAFHWVWRITALCGVFAFLATETFVKFISAVWELVGAVLKSW